VYSVLAKVIGTDVKRAFLVLVTHLLPGADDLTMPCTDGHGPPADVQWHSILTTTPVFSISTSAGSKHVLALQ